jgi:hypothetical protein
MLLSPQTPLILLTPLTLLTLLLPTLTNSSPRSPPGDGASSLLPPRGSKQRVPCFFPPCFSLASFSHACFSLAYLLSARLTKPSSVGGEEATPTTSTSPTTTTTTASATAIDVPVPPPKKNSPRAGGDVAAELLVTSY